MSAEESQSAGSDHRPGTGLSRACDACRRMKIRCVDRADPPCRRCRTTGSKCEFTLESYPSPYRIKTNQARVIQIEQRMDNVEKVVRSMEGMMRRFVESQVGKSTGSASPASVRPPTTLDDWVLSAESSRVDEDLGSTRDNHEETEDPVGGSVGIQHAGDPEDSRSGSGTSRDEDDYLFEASTGAPFKGLLYRDERERERAKRRRARGNEGNDSDSEVEAPVRKRRGSLSLVGGSQRLSSTKQSQSLLTSLGGRPVASGGSGRLQDFLDRAEPSAETVSDPIELGFCTEEQGRHLLDLYYQGAHAFLPVFDPVTDTWESLRSRSPFCVTTILMAGQIAASGSEQALSLRPDLREKLVAHAESIARDTLFSSVANIESVQAMVILSNWGDTAWRPGNHLLNLALDMDLHLCLPRLVQGGMGGGKSGAELERERPLVAGARLWLATCKTHTELCFNYGRPILVDIEEIVRLGRVFLSHPLSNRDDSRCVTLCESFSIRQPINRALRQGVKGRPLDNLMSTALKKLEEWERYWLDYYSSMGLADDDFLVTELITIKNYAMMQVSVAFLSEVKSKRDIDLLPASRREVIVSAVRASARLLARAARGAENSKIRHGNRNVRLGLAHAARYLIRMASLIPESINLREAAKDVELLADQLGRFPDFYFSQFLHHVVVEARRKRQLPPASALPSRHPSPGLEVAPLPEPVESVKTCDSTESTTTSRLDFDFGIADNIFASEDWMSIVGGVGANDQPMLDPGNAFPFLPLELSRFPPSDVSEMVDHSELLLSFGQNDTGAVSGGGEPAQPAGFWPVTYNSNAL
ncbi:uncharacterized protein LOC62_01G001697 [Vanrija pseudolonga]|uniref:Zn(2)-C6 fungal-type domain-containing protein n=1 Tax=Vanrija pseudolonga TaxID=143232 RepID=A0AAF1BG44_9TREE|nr:hypothetical protein LOC62_01G001697 [Vanrija pseudolonga]